MSVINQMLKDLEKRQQSLDAQGNEAMITPKLDYQPTRKSAGRMWLWCMLGLVLGSGLTYGLVFWNGKLALANKAPASENEEQVVLDQGDVAGNKVASEAKPTAKLEMQPATTDQLEKPEVANQQFSQAPSAQAVTVSTQHQSLLTTETAEQTVKIDAVSTDEPAQTQRKLKQPQTVVSVNPTVSARDTSAQGTLAQAQSVKPSSQQQLALTREQVANKVSENQRQVTVTPVVLTPAQLAAKKMQQAQQAESLGELAQAMTIYHELINQDSSQHSARKKLAALLYGQSRYDQAKQVLSQGIALYPEYQEYLLLHARVSQGSNDLAQAMATLSTMKDTGSYAKQKWLQMSELAQQLKDYPRAEQAFRQLARLEPNQGRWWMGLGYALDAQQDFTHALAAYQNAIDNQNLSPKAREFVKNRIQLLGDYR